MNASDARSQKLLRSAMDGVTDSSVVSGLLGVQASAIPGATGKRLIIMDGEK